MTNPLNKLLKKLGVEDDTATTDNKNNDIAQTTPPKPKAPPPPKGPKNTRGFGGSTIRRTSGRGR